MGNDTPSNRTRPDQQRRNQGAFQDERNRNQGPLPEGQQEDKDDQNDMDRDVERGAGARA